MAVIEEEDTVERESIPFETIYETNSEIAEGQTRIRVPGVEGSLETTYHVIKVDGEVVQREETGQMRTEPTAQVIEQGAQRLERPRVSINTLAPHPESKSIDVTYVKTDTTNSLISAVAKIYKGSELIKSVPIEDLARTLEAGKLELYTDYTLKTELTYRLNDGEHTELEDYTRDFRLEYKKIEFKDIDSIELYEKVGDSFKRRLALDELPTDTSAYMVKIKSDRNKEAWLPVHSFTESTKDGQATYEVKVAFDELVQERSGQYEPDLTFHISRPKQEAGAYHSFKALIEAMRAMPSGRFILGADMTADEVAVSESDKAYISGQFSGELIGAHGGNKFAIYNLAQPLFEQLTNAKVSALDLKEVAIQGNIEASHNIGGLIYEVNSNSVLENVSFEGTIRSTLNTKEASNVGGVVGNLTNNSKLTGANANVDLYFNHRNNNQRAGGLVAMATAGARVSNAVVAGNLFNSLKGGQNGGIVGSTWRGGAINEVVSKMNVTAGNDIFGDSGFSTTNMTNAYVTKPSTDRYATVVDEATATEKNFFLSAECNDRRLK